MRSKVYKRRNKAKQGAICTIFWALGATFSLELFVIGIDQFYKFIHQSLLLMVK